MIKTDHTFAGKKVLEIESKALQELSSTLNEHFNQVVEDILQLSGHVVLTGMGKSGHIAHKIAATLASTGTPSFFVHPAEANHGDLGMLGTNDAIIALSDSGETEELFGITHYAKRKGLPVIAITRDKNSTLGRTAKHTLIIPEAEPACPMRLAPTTSTTMMIALGDALAVALLQARGFSAQDFHEFHPGGSLGRKLMQVQQVMHVGEKIPIVSAQTKMSDVLVVMTSKGFGCAVVADDDNKLLGIITDGDLRRHMEDDLVNRTALQVMSAKPKTIHPTMLIANALEFMYKRSITVSIIVDLDDKVQGVLHIHDCL